jgi:hypothetical protein
VPENRLGHAEKGDRRNGGEIEDWVADQHHGSRTGAARSSRPRQWPLMRCGALPCRSTDVEEDARSGSNALTKIKARVPRSDGAPCRTRGPPCGGRHHRRAFGYRHPHPAFPAKATCSRRKRACKREDLAARLSCTGLGELSQRTLRIDELPRAHLRDAFQLYFDQGTARTGRAPSPKPAFGPLAMILASPHGLEPRDKGPPCVADLTGSAGRNVE